MSHTKRTAEPLRSKGGPKHMRTLQFLCLLGTAKGVRVAPEVRVGAIANIAPEATQHGRNPPARDGKVVGQANQVNACPYTWSAKRAYRRARARAAAHGTTVYRGRIHDQSSLQVIRGQAPLTNTVKRQRLTRQPSAIRNNGRLRYLTWNMSGASSAACQEFTCWLEAHQSEWDVVMVQERHWKGDTRCYTTGPWHVVSTGAQKGDTSSGVAVLTHRRMTSADSLSYRVYAQGRVLHVRVPASKNFMDVICVYQYVWRGSCNTEKNVQNRRKIWLAMRQAIASVLRNDFIMGGDENTPIYTLRPHTGTAILHSQSEYPDQDEFHSILQDHGLTLLNTWHAKNKITCVNSGSHSQLDYLVCRIQRADFQAKHCQLLRDCALGTRQENHHKPVGASVRKLQPWTLPPKRPDVARNHEVQKAIVHNSPTALAMKASIAEQLQTIPEDFNLQQLHQRLNDVLQAAMATFFPRQRSNHDERISAHPQSQRPVQKMWELYRAFKTSNKASVKRMFCSVDAIHGFSQNFHAGQASC